jgi:hypothetical protein
VKTGPELLVDFNDTKAELGIAISELGSLIKEMDPTIRFFGEHEDDQDLHQYFANLTTLNRNSAALTTAAAKLGKAARAHAAIVRRSAGSLLD